MYDRTEGRSSLTVTSLVVESDENAIAPETMEPELLPGPWKFDFEAPKR